MAESDVSTDDELATRFLESDQGKEAQAAWLLSLKNARQQREARTALQGLTPDQVQTLLDELQNKQ